MQKLPRDFQVLIVAVILVASASILALSPQINWEAWPELLLFTVLIAVSAMLPIPDPRGGATNATPTLVTVLFSVHGPAAGILIAFAAFVVGSSTSRGWVPWRRLWNGAQVGISAALGGLVFKSLGGSAARLDLFTFILPYALAALTYQLSNNFFVALFFSRLRRLPLLSTWFSDVVDLFWSNLVGVPSAALLAILYVSYHPAVLVFYLALLFSVRYALKIHFEQKKMFTQAIDSLVVAIDSNFPEGRGHSKRVANTATAIAKQLNLPETTIEMIEMGALLHDVGMIGLIDMLEPARPEENLQDDKLRKHVTLGAEIVRGLSHQGKDMADIVLYHHEEYDGRGSPEGLKGEQIPLGARIVGLAEAYESMLATGIGRNRRLTASEIVEILRLATGKRFDPRVYEAFALAFEQGSIDSSSVGEVEVLVAGNVSHPA